LHYRKLGSSDLEISEISLGSWLTYDGPVEAETTRACTEAAFDVGINFFDTANAYGRGAAESAWGDILSGHARDSYILATKVWAPMSDDPADRGLSGAQIAKQIDASLTRLRTDHVDLYQAHRFDPNVAIEETVEALQLVVTQGKARYLGFSEWLPEQIQAAIDIAGPGLFVSSQPQYSMLWPEPEAEVFPVCASNGIGQIVWSPLAQGVLTGKYKPRQPIPDDSRFANEATSGLKHLVFQDETLAAVQQLIPIAEGAGLTLPHLALAWVLRRPELVSAITGASRPQQLLDNVAASGIALSPDVLASVDAVLAGIPDRGSRPTPWAPHGIKHR
jgi:aryl-alcohol dehydrogenase-like predicted oxidoreductase